MGDGSGFTTAAGEDDCDVAVGVKPAFTFDAVDVIRSLTAPAFSIAAALLGGGGGAAAGAAVLEVDAPPAEEAAEEDAPVTCCECWAETMLDLACVKLGSAATAAA